METIIQYFCQIPEMNKQSIMKDLILRQRKSTAQLAGVVEYADGISAEGLDIPQGVSWIWH